MAYFNGSSACINCSCPITNTNSYSLSSEIKLGSVRRSTTGRRKMQKVPNPSINWKNSQVPLSQALDLIFQFSARHRTYQDLYTGHLCNDCTRIFEPLFQLFMKFIDLAQKGSFMYNALENFEAMQRNLEGYLTRNKIASRRSGESNPLSSAPPEDIVGRAGPASRTRKQPMKQQEQEKIGCSQLTGVQFVQSNADTKETNWEAVAFQIIKTESDELDGPSMEFKCEPDLPELNQIVSSQDIGPPPRKRIRKSKSKKILDMQQAMGPEESPEIFKCDKCNDTFRCRDTHTRHVAIHTDSKKFWCSICSCGFKHGMRLHYHMFKLHPEAQIPGKTSTYSDHKCLICSRKLLSELALRKHLVDKHFHCPCCQQTCSTKEEVNTHLDKEHGSDWLKLICDLCDYKTSKPILFRSHRLQIHSLGEERFSCEVCGKKYIKKVQLTEHQTTHSEERPFKCDQCVMSYKTRSGLAFHKLTVHAGVKFMCEICGHASSSPANLRKHVAGVHHGIKQTQRKTNEGVKKKRYRLPNQN